MDLQQLRHLNQDLLRRLKANQEEFRRRLPIRLATPERRGVPSSKNGIQPPFCTGMEGAALSASAAGNSHEARPGLRSPFRGTRAQSGQQREGRSPSRGPLSSPSVVVVPSGEAVSGSDETAEGAPQKSPLVALHSVEERKKPKPREELAATPAKEGGRQGASAQMPPTPKSILLTPGGKHAKARKKKEAGRVTFVSNTEERLIPADSLSACPFLGYDWIAGLLEMDTSLAEKPEEYFAELQNFRQVNKEACIHDQDLALGDMDSSALDRETEPDAASHQCVFCYRLNKRLFTVPMDPESACPVCKTPRAEKPPETLVEPAFVRISIPRATFLPTYEQKIHRRKSYEMEDNLALPSHCLAGWENPIRIFTPILSSLDLHSSLDSQGPYQNRASLDETKWMMLILFSSELWLLRYVSGASLPPAVGDPNIHWNSWQPWVCMCELHKQARIRHFVVWAANVSLDLKTSEFWQEKACSLEDCTACAPEDCPGSKALPGFFSRFEILSAPKPHEVKIPLPPLDFPSYDSLPVVDDKEV